MWIVKQKIENKWNLLKKLLVTSSCNVLSSLTWKQISELISEAQLIEPSFQLVSTVLPQDWVFKIILQYTSLCLSLSLSQILLFHHKVNKENKTGGAHIHF